MGGQGCLKGSDKNSFCDHKDQTLHVCTFLSCPFAKNARQVLLTPVNHGKRASCVMDTQSLMMSEYINKGRENCVGATSPWMGHEFLQGENALMVPTKVSLPLSTAHV